MKPTFLFPTVAEVPPGLKPKRMRGGKLYELEDCNILCTGPGRQVEITMERFSASLRETLLVMIGYGGGLIPRLQTGDLVVCKFFYAKEAPVIKGSRVGDFVAAGLENLGIVAWRGSSYTGEQIVGDTSLKTELTRKGSLVMVADMENYWAARKAQEWETSIIAMRIVLDSFAENLPDWMDTLKSSGELSWFNVCRRLILFPSQARTMMRVTRKTPLLLSRLRQCCDIIMGLCRFRPGIFVIHDKSSGTKNCYP